MIKNILFDMGQVLIRFDRDYFMERLGVSEEDRALLMREVYLSVEWVQMDRGTLCEEEAFRKIAPRLPQRLHETAMKLICMWDRPILEVDGMYELAEELKALGLEIQTILDETVMDQKLAEMYKIQHEDFQPLLYLYYPTLLVATQSNITGILNHNKHYPDIHAVVIE